MTEKEPASSRTWVWVTLALIALLGAFFYWRSTRASIIVRTATVERNDILSTVSTNGKVLPKVDFQAHAAISGMIQKLYVKLGQEVQKGQQLIRMNDIDAQRNLAGARATLDASQNSLHNVQQGGTAEERIQLNSDIKAAQLQLDQARTFLQTRQQLQAQGSASANEVADARQRLTEAQQRMNTLRARQTGRFTSQDLDLQRAQVQQAKIGMVAAQNAVSVIDVRAPFTGTVYAVRVNQFDNVNPGDPLIDMADLRALQVQAYFDEPEIGKLSAGEPVTIVWDAKPNLLWHGHIVQAPTTIINYNTRNVGECMISVDDPTSDLLPNTNVTVKVVTQQKLHALSLPREALRTEGTRNFVYKIVDGRLQRTPVQVGAVNLTLVEITGGVQEHDVVALGATTEAELIDGMRVKVQR